MRLNFVSPNSWYNRFQLLTLFISETTMFLFVLRPFIFFNLKIIKEDIRRRYQCQIAQDTPMPGHENYAGIGITLKKKEKEKRRSFSHVRGTSCASSARRIPTNLSWPVTPVRRGEEGRRRRRGIRKRRERI